MIFAVQIVVFAVVGTSFGVLAFFLLDTNAHAEGYQDGLFAGQYQERLAHGDWNPPVSPAAWNPPEVPAVERRRSPDLKTEHPESAPSRPVFYRNPR